MANTLPNIPLPANTWVDLYAASGIAVGTQITVQNLCDFNIRLCSKAIVPMITDGYQIILQAQTATNQSGDLGAWAFCSTGGSVNIKVA